jgi:hypothetical protein
MKQDLINKGINATENKQNNIGAMLFVLFTILFLTAVTFCGLYIKGLANDQQYERKMHELDSINASLQATNNELMHDNLNRND